MKRDKLLGMICIGLGVVLLSGSGLLMLYNSQEDQAAEVSAQQVIAALETRQTVPEPIRTEPSAPVTEALEETTVVTVPTDPTDPPTLSSEILEGHEYVGYLVFPSLDRKLPVMRIQYLEDLQISPCLEKGSPLTNDAVISAHNYPSHFGPIRDWKGGEEVIFTTLAGDEIQYTVSQVKTIEPTDVTTVMESEHDMVLYTCTTGGKKRVMIACDRLEN